MQIEKLHVPETVVEACVVVIDVMRAFTTAAYAFSSGASKIIPVGTIEEAFALRDEHKDFLLMGEIQGKPIPGFDFSNSPSEIKTVDLKGRTLVHRTSSGTQGVVHSLKSHKILVSSFTVAEATLKRILHLNPPKVSFVITGQNDGDEDLALADYLESKISRKEKIDPAPYLQRVVNSTDGRLHTSKNPNFPYSDLHEALAIDIFSFSMEIFHENQMPVLYPVDEFGEKLVKR